MKYLNTIMASVCLAVIGMMMLTSCEGADLYKVGAPDWISEKADSIAAAKAAAVVTLIPTPEVLGTEDNTQPFWTVFTEDYKLEKGKTYQIPLTNYGGGSNWNNFVIILRNEAKDYEYAILRADNWGWGTGYSGEESDAHFDKSTEAGRDWATWLKAMSRSQCQITITHNGTTVDVKISMIGADGVAYSQNYLNVSNNIVAEDLYLAFTVDNSHVVFGTPTEIPDSQPASMVLSGVPSEVLIGTPFEEAMANVTAEVTFEDGMTKTVGLDELQVEAVPDFTTVGTKNLVAVYNKTYKGENCDKPIIAVKTFAVVKELSAFTQTVVVPIPHILGAEDNTTGFWGAHTENIKIAPKETKVATFTNYSSCANNWNNFCIVLCKADNAEYAVVRADNYGWGDGYAACTPTMEEGRDWDVWRPAMDGAKVTTYITNNGDGTADIKAVMVGNNGVTYTQEYKGINTVDPDNFYFRYTVDGCHLVFDNEVGAPDCSTGFWGAHSPNIQVIGHQVCTVNFTNYSSCVNNWNNFVLVLCSADGATEYAVVRADNYGWGSGYAACTPTMEEGRNWDVWRPAMNGAKVTAKIVNNGDGTADIKVVMHGTNGVDYTQDYIGINTVDPDNLYFNFTVDGSYLVFE